MLASGAPLCSFEHEVGDPRAVPVSFMHGGRAIVGGSVIGRVNVWDISLCKKIQVLSIPGASYKHLPRLPSSEIPMISPRQSSCPRRKLIKILATLVLIVPQAHYVAGASSTDYKFYIATGTYNDDEDSVCIVWKAEALEAIGWCVHGVSGSQV